MPVPVLDLSPSKRQGVENLRRSKSTEYEMFKGERELNEESEDQGSSGSSAEEDINQSALES